MELLFVIERHIRKHGIPATRFGRDAVNDPRFVLDLRNGREPGPRMRQRVMAVIAAQSRQAGA